MAAFRMALEMGAKAVELDVHQTRDGRLVVIHDDDLRRTGRQPGRVKDLLFAEMRRVDVGSWYDRRFKGERPPALEEVFDLCLGKAELHVEIKQGSSLYPGIEKRVVGLIARRKAWRAACVSSFDHQALREARRLEPRLRIGYLLGRTPMRTAYRETAELKAESLNLSLRQVDARKVRAGHERGLRVLVYTVNQEKDAARLDKMGVDGVFSNDPELLPI
jgi:glycerophosphoryl diester phosphodiesterase